MAEVRRAYPELQVELASYDAAEAFITDSNIPLDFNSSVQPLRSSCTSSGSTLVRVHASSHCGFGGASFARFWSPPFFDLTLVAPSLPFDLEKKPMAAVFAIEGMY